MLHNASFFKPGSAPTIITASKERVQAQLHGDITIHVLTDTGATKEITLKDCLYVPKLGLNLLSTTRFVDERDVGAHFIQSKGQQHLVLPAGEVVPLKMQGGIPWLKTTPVVRALMAGEERGAGGMESYGGIMGGDRENKSKIPTGHRENKSKIPEAGHGENKSEEGGGRGTATRTSKDNEDHETALLAETAPLTSKQLLHDRLGHPGKDRLEQVLEAHNGEEWLKDIKDDDMGACDSCHTMKARRQPINKEPIDHSKRQPGELLIIDMTGPVAHTSIGGARFALIIQDARTGVTEAFPMVSKDGAPQALQQFHLEQRTLRAGSGIPLIENHTVIQCDNDSVFLGRPFLQACEALVFQLRTSGPGCPSRQGKAESAIYHLFQDTTALLHRTACKPELWALALKHMAWLRNRLPTRTLNGASPMQALTGQQPMDLHRARLFGCTAYALIPKDGRAGGKMGAKAARGQYVGESTHGSGHLILVNSELRTAVHVTFDEQGTHTAGDTAEEHYQLLPTADGEQDPPDNLDHTEQAPATDNRDEDAAEGEQESPQAGSKNIFQQIDEVLGSYPTAFTVMDVLDDAPLTMLEAQGRQDWKEYRDAAAAEMAGHENNGTWTKIDISEVPPGKQVLNSRMSLKVKLGAQGKVVKYKGRLLVIGCSEKADPTENNFSPVASISTVRILISLAAANGWELATSDISQAYTQAPPRKDTYVKAPKNVDGYDSTKDVFFLRKNLYGLRSGAIQFYKTLAAFLMSIGLKRTHADPCLFWRREGGETLIIVVFVDDILQGGTREAIERFQGQLQGRFKITSELNATEYLGFVMRRRKDGSIGVSQEHKINMAVALMNLEHQPPTTTPMIPGEQLSKDDHEDISSEMEAERYRACVGLLLHISGVYRADIAFAINQLCRYNNEPRANHQRTLVHLVRFLNGTKAEELVLGQNKDTNITAWSDADYGGCRTTGRSTSGTLVRFCGGSVAYSSKRQDTVATSTAHSELIALSTVAKTVMHLRQLLGEIEVHQDCTTIYTDNEAARHIAMAIGATAKIKHARITDFYIQELVATGEVKVVHVPGRNMLSDCLTKSLPRPAATEMRRKLLGPEKDE